MLGHQEAAVEQLHEVVKLVPQDKLADALLKKYGEGAGDQAAPPPPLPPPIPTTPASPMAPTPPTLNPSPAGGGPRPVGGDGGVDS